MAKFDLFVMVQRMRMGKREKTKKAVGVESGNLDKSSENSVGNIG